ncbi:MULTISPECIES: phosphate ABC transporter permease PstA [Halomonadaceae]|uniref:Phosphate transport system permease protein PstA n=1 Tax=Vreelandella halophila TaxID=86177 RepID=A0A9X4YBQ3_9GAMM|nr:MULTISPECIES: phosphate ABC transporter permease PstA [Halomonas]MYL26138.1 phosphate ABC transporter permease PstA [Halomonas utahensis]MYL73300.1 phosphate ABC transporter permease PstA [Halomonas sp. 22501_18_FS]
MSTRRLTGSANDPHIRRRYRAEKRFKAYCIGAVGIAFAIIVAFFTDIISQGYTAFWQHQVQVTLEYNDRSARLGQFALDSDMRDIASRGATRSIPLEMEDNPDLMGTTDQRWVPVKAEIDQYLKHGHDLPAELRQQVDALADSGRIQSAFNTRFFTTGDSKLPELAGIFSAAVGTLYVLGITLVFAFPIGVMSAIYLEEFAPDNKLTQTIEVNINNLAAVPSIIFGLLGLALFINFFGVPRSSALAGGLTLGLMTLPIIIISTRAALRAVPDPIRQGAFAMGCSRWQVVRDHVLPSSLPGILTGTIIGLAQAMGETAPLIIVGMIAYIPEAPSGIFESATVLPAQVFTWASEPQQAYVEKTAAGIMVLLAVLLTLNATAVFMRRKFERRW